jgi:hypothetical protein
MVHCAANGTMKRVKMFLLKYRKPGLNNSTNATFFAGTSLALFP